jgi:hypothetical protein
VLITGGAVETRDGVICGVPKLTLVSRLQALLHEGRLKIQKELSEAATLVPRAAGFPGRVHRGRPSDLQRKGR